MNLFHAAFINLALTFSVHFAAFENEILAIQARKEQIVMETDDDARDKDVPAEKDRIGLTEVRMTF